MVWKVHYSESYNKARDKADCKVQGAGDKPAESSADAWFADHDTRRSLGSKRQKTPNFEMKWAPGVE